MTSDIVASSEPSHTPNVTIVIPVRNCKDYIHQALESVLTQSYTSFEVLIIDDGSEDFDYGLLAQLDPRIRVIRLDGLGVSHARNTGVQQARGELIAFLDADDVWFPGKLEAQVRYFEAHPHVGIVYGGFTRWEQSQDGSFAPASALISDCKDIATCEPERSGWIYDKLLMGLLVGMNTAMIRRRYFRRLGGFDEGMRIGEDYDFWLRASRITEMHALNGTVALYRIHGSSAMHRLSDANHMAKILRTTFYRWGCHNLDGSGVSQRQFFARLAASEFDHGYAHYWNGNPRVAMGAFKNAFVGGYKRWRSLVYVILSAAKAITHGPGAASHH